MTDRPATDDPTAGEIVDEDGLSVIAAKALAGVVVLLAASFAGVQIYESMKGDSYVVDYYPPTSQRTGRVVFRWPSRGLQMPPVELQKLPASVAERWGGNQPKRTTLEPTTILPGGRVVEADTATPPGRFVIALGRETFVVSPESDWTLGRPSTEPPE